MKRLIQKVLGNNLLSSGILSLIIKGLGIAASLVISIILGNNLGPENLGVISFSNKLIALSIVVGAFGFDTYLVKSFATSEANLKSSVSLNTAIASSGIFAFVVLGIVILFPKSLSVLFFDGDEYSAEVVAIAIGLVPNCFNRVLNGALNGKGFLWQSIMLNETLMTLLLSIVLVSCFYLFDTPLTTLEICWSYTITRYVVFSVSLLLMNKLAKLHVNLRKLDFREIKKTANMYFVTLFGLLNSTFDLLIISLFLSNYELGIYSIVSRIAISLIIITQVTSTVLNPKVASFYYENNIKGLKTLLKKTLLLLSIISGSLFVIILLFGKSILGVWGPEFISAYSVLIIVCSGQMVNATLSPLGLILTMCGGEKNLRNTLAIVFAISIVTIPLVTKEFGLMGAAISFSSVLIIQSLTVVTLASRYLKAREHALQQGLSGAQTM